MRRFALLLFLVLCACSLTGEQSPSALKSLAPGAYRLERAHASILFRVKHLGLSSYSARFADFDATLDFDPQNPAASRVSAVIDPRSVRTDHPTDPDWDRRLAKDLLDAERHPEITFTSRRIEVTGPFAGRVTGDLSLMGVTRPVTLEVAFNGAAPAAALYQGRDAVGFSARATLRRSDFGSSRYSAFVGDEVEVIIEAEFTQSPR